MTTPRPSRHSSRRAFAAVVIAVGFSAGTLAACGDDDDDTAATTTTAAGNVGTVLPPIIADLNSIDGTTVEVRQGGTIDLTGDSETFTDWTAEIADAKVAEFVPGRTDGSASFNPGIKALAPGTTTVKMTNSTSSETVSFTVTVTAA
jgi:hypothetical protein